MFLLEAGSAAEKKEWVTALWSNIFYANPSKRHGGVSYPVELQVCIPTFTPSLDIVLKVRPLRQLGLGQESKRCVLIVEMPGLRLVEAATSTEMWKRPIHHVKSITRCVCLDPTGAVAGWLIAAVTTRTLGGEKAR